MNRKQQRLLFTKQLVLTKKIESQDELLLMLSENGYKATQATLSRDLKELKVAKMPDEDGKYYYKVHGLSFSVSEERQFERYLSDSVSLAFSANMAVLRTSPGHASAVAGMVDAHFDNQILGSIAGDDTIFIVLKESFSKNEFTQELRRIIPKLSYLN